MFWLISCGSILPGFGGSQLPRSYRGGAIPGAGFPRFERPGRTDPFLPGRMPWNSRHPDRCCPAPGRSASDGRLLRTASDCGRHRRSRCAELRSPESVPVPGGQPPDRLHSGLRRNGRQHTAASSEARVAKFPAILCKYSPLLRRGPDRTVKRSSAGQHCSGSDFLLQRRLWHRSALPVPDRHSVWSCSGTKHPRNADHRG